MRMSPAAILASGRACWSENEGVRQEGAGEGEVKSRSFSEGDGQGR